MNIGRPAIHLFVPDVLLPGWFGISAAGGVLSGRQLVKDIISNVEHWLTAKSMQVHPISFDQL